MSISESQHQDCTVQDLLEVVEGQQETIEELQVEEQQETIEQLAKDNAEDRQRLTEAEERLDDVEGQESTGSNPTPTPTPQTEKTAETEPLTPIERLLEGDRQDVAGELPYPTRSRLTPFAP
jgi:TolA-binding protein